MLIRKIISEIWKPVSIEYEKGYVSANKMDEMSLYNELINYENETYQYPGVTMNLFITVGCGYRYNNKNLCGCSMCDYQSKNAFRQGQMLSLRERNESLYIEALYHQFTNTRNGDYLGNFTENISGYDTFNPLEFPYSAYTLFFGKHKLFIEEPFIYNLEVRATSVNKIALSSLKEQFPKRQRVSIEFGVEVKNEWLRNHWLNKSVTDQCIVNAINLIHEYKFKAVGNILLGIPCLTEKQSIDIFVETALWLDDIGIDKMIVLPLNRKEYSLQGFFYKSSSNDKILYDKGLVNGEHTSIPWIFSLISAIDKLNKVRPEIAKKIDLVQLTSKTNTIKNESFYNSTKECKCNSVYIEYLEEFNKDKNFDLLLRKFNDTKCSSCYEEYITLLNKQGNPKVKETLIQVVDKLLPNLFNENISEMKNSFIEELKDFDM